MRIDFTLGKEDITYIQLRRNQFTGKFTYTENGVEKLLRSPMDMSTHLPTENIAYYRFTVGTTERFYIRIIHTWPERYPAFKPQQYEILVDGEPFKTFISF